MASEDERFERVRNALAMHTPQADDPDYEEAQFSLASIQAELEEARELIATVGTPGWYHRRYAFLHRTQQPDQRSTAPCWCCSKPAPIEAVSEWEGRLNGYCLDCALARCDYEAGACGHIQRSTAQQTGEG